MASCQFVVWATTAVLCSSGNASFDSASDQSGEQRQRLLTVLDVFRLKGLGRLEVQAPVGSSMAAAQGGETIFIEGLPPFIPSGETVTCLVKLSTNTTPLFGYSLALRATADPQSQGTVAVNVSACSFYPTQNLIVAGGAPIDPLFSVIIPWNADGVFVSANTDDGSTVLAIPDVNDVLAEITFQISDDAAGEFVLELGPASALSDGEGFAVPFVFVGGEIQVCEVADFTCDCLIDVNDLLIVVNAWGSCPQLSPDLDGSGVIDVNDLLIVINSWGQSGVPADLDQSGLVDVNDLLIVISNWGMELPFCPDCNDDGAVDVNDLLCVINEWGVPAGCN